MNYYIVRCLTCIILIVLTKNLFTNNKAIFVILTLIISLIFTNSIISIVKLNQYTTNVSLYYHQNIFIWNAYERILNYAMITFSGILLILIVRRIILRLRNRVSKKMEIENKKILFILIGFLFCSITLLSVFAKNVYYTKETQDNDISIEQLDIFNPNEYDEENIFDILVMVSGEIENEELSNVFANIEKCNNIRIVERFETDIYDGTFSYYIQDRLYNGFNIDKRASLQYGEFEVIHLEYTFTEGRTISDFHTFILYGESVLNELMVEVITISDTDTLTFIMSDSYNDGRKIEFYSEILKTDYR